jgi:hypothetical protein
VRAAAALLAFTALFDAASARADVSSFLAGGGGYALEKNYNAGTTDRATAMTFSLGVGSTPRAPIVVGGLFRTVTFFGMGTELALGPRVATGGFARGDWGVALDIAAGTRWYKGDVYGQYPLQGVLTFGSPWGFQLGVAADVWSLTGAPYARGTFAVLEFDFLRFTVMRQGSSESFWPNPAPAGGRVR